MSYYLVSPDSALSFSFDWSAWLDYSSPADEIASRQWTIEPENDALSSPSTPTLTNATGEIVVATGFIAGRVYRLTETITSAGGLVDARTIVLRCDPT